MWPTVNDLRRYVGAQSNCDDDLLLESLNAAIAFLEGRIYASSVGSDDVTMATLLLASRLFKRRQTPEGIGGFGFEGGVVRIAATDPDVRALIERHLDLGSDDPTTAVGIG